MRQVAQLVGEADRLPEAPEIFAARRAWANMGEFAILLGDFSVMVGAKSRLQKRSSGNHSRPPFNDQPERAAFFARPAPMGCRPSSHFDHGRGYAGSRPAAHQKLVASQTPCRDGCEATSIVSALLRALPQHEFLDLAGRGLWQRAEQHGPRRLIMREVLAAEGDDFLGSGVRFRLQG